MKSVNQQLLSILQQPAFADADADACSALVQKWRQANRMTDAAVATHLMQLGAQLLHNVRNKETTPAAASELLVRLIALSDLPIPATVFALQEVLQTMSEHNQVAANNEQIKREMGRILPSMPTTHLHQVDDCRYTGRYREPKRSA